MDKIIIGRKDKVDLPELGLEKIDAKIDTGAYGSALHCHEIEVLNENDLDVLYFKVLDPSHKEYEDRVYRFEQFSDKAVKSSSGEVEHRYTILTKMIVFEEEHKIEFSLTDREAMKYPILLGRKFLSGKFIVEVDQKNLSHKQKKILK